MKICMSGVRGHNGYVLEGIRLRKDLSIAAITGDGDDHAPLYNELVSIGGDPAVYESCEEMLDAEKPDVLTVAGPFNRNADICISAFRRGIHVFCEKPIALTLEELERVRKSYSESNVHFGVMMGLRYDPAFYTAWKLVRSGAVGEVRLINTRKSYKLGTRSEYFRSRITYGGTIPWVGSHAIDWIHWFSGQRFLSVNAHHSIKANNGHGELEATALCQFALSNEVLASASIDYLRPSRAASHGDDRVRVAGTSGVIEVAGGEVRLINEHNDGTEPILADCPLQIFLDFLCGIEDTAKPIISADDAFTVAEAYLNARRSADRGETVRFER